MQYFAIYLALKAMLMSCFSQRMTVPMMPMGQGTQQQSPIMPQPGGIIRGQIMHMPPQQQLRPSSSAVSFIGTCIVFVLAGSIVSET